MKPFVESGMTFGPYPDGHCFRIEQSETYRNLQEGVKIAEFLLLKTEKKNSSVWIIEAKSSSPRPGAQPNFDGFIDEIRDKLANTLSLGIAAILKRHPAAVSELSAPFQTLDLASVGFRLVLIVNEHQKEWLPPLQDQLRSTLLATTKIWALGSNSVAVINHEGAKHFGLISAP